MSIAKWIEKNARSLAGKRIAISGATGGIGARLCEHLAGLGADLVLLDRSIERSQALGERLKICYPGLRVDYLTLDLTDIRSVKNAVAELQCEPLSGLILNAGAYCIPRRKCDTGYDNVFQINFAAPYFLARELKAHIIASGGRLVAVGSIAHNYSKTDFEDIDFSTRKKASLVYGNAKRHLMFSLYGLYRDTDALAVTHPGITFTNITAHYPKLIFAFIKHPMKLIFMKPKKAALSILLGLFDSTSENEWIGPRLFNVWGMPKKKILKTCSQAEAERICRVADGVYERLKTQT